VARPHEYTVAEGSVLRQGCPAGAFAYIGGAARARQFLLGLLRPSPPGAQAPHRRREKTSGNRPSSSANGIAVAGFSSRKRKQEVGVEFFFSCEISGVLQRIEIGRFLRSRRSHKNIFYRNGFLQNFCEQPKIKCQQQHLIFFMGRRECLTLCDLFCSARSSNGPIICPM
jgi:hypothetical protein